MKTIRLLVTAVVSLALGVVYAGSSYYGGPWTDPDTGYTWMCKIDPKTAEAEIFNNGYSAAISPSPTGSVTIPVMVRLSIVGHVTRIGSYAFCGCSGLTSVTIPDSVTSIGGRAFEGCSGLTSVTIPDSVTSIGEDAFSGCSGLKSVTIGNGLSSIGFHPFRGCSGLMSISVGSGNANYKSVNGLLLSKDGKTLVQGVNGDVVIPDSVTSIRSYAFEGCSGLRSVTMPNSVTSIGNHVFSGCNGLTSVTIPNSVTSIGSYAFADCSGLMSISVGSGNANYKSVNGLLLSKDGKTLVQGVNGDVVIPDSVTSIRSYAFEGRSGLTSVTIPNSVTSIGKYAFWWCSGLTSVTIGNGVTSIGEGAFRSCNGLASVYITDLAKWCGISFGDDSDNPLSYAHNLYLNGAKVTALAIPYSVTSIGSYAFNGCSGLTSVAIPDSVTSIGSSAFSGCSGLTSVAIPDSVTSIESSAFSGCNGLTSVTIPNSVTSIGDYAFSGCNGLTSVTIPNSVTSIGDYAFRGCSSLTSVTIPNSVTRIGDWAFENCSGLTSVTIPDSVTSIGKYAFDGCSGLASVHITDLAKWCGVSFGNDSANPLCCAHNLYLGGAKVTALTVPNSVTSIAGYAFSGCSGLASVTIPASVTSIGKYAFSGCVNVISLTAPYFPSGLNKSQPMSVTIPNSVTSIGDSAFEGCSGLASVTIPNSVTSIGKYAFCNCSGLTSVTIGNSVTSIGKYAFYNCSGLTSVTIPNSVTSIGDSAFDGCSGLTSVTIPQVGVDQFKSVFSGYSELSVIISDGVTNIVEGSFRDCGSLTSITIPDSVLNIGESAFLGCSRLMSVMVPQLVLTQGLASVFPSARQTISKVTIRGNMTSLDDGAFEGYFGLRIVDLPERVRRIGVGAFPDNVKLVIFHGAPPEVVDADGKVIDPDTYSGGGVFGPYGSIPSDVHVVYPPEFADAWGGELRRWCGAWAGCCPDVAITPGGKTVFSGSVAVSIESSWTNAVIHYTADGVEPTEASPVYRKPITVNRPCIIKACAISPDCEWSHVVSAQFGYGRTADPRIYCSQWTTFYHRDNMVSFYSSTAGAEYVYTLDGSDPTKGGIKYTGPFSISTSTVVRVVAKSTDNVDSDVVEQTFTREWETVGTPEIETGDMDSANVVTISCWTDDAEIWYSTGGGYQRYTGPFRVFGATTVRAYAVKDDWLQSATATREIVKTWNDGGVVGQNGKIFVSTTSSIWREDTSVSYSGGASLRSGTIGDGKTSDLRFSMAGKGTISFHWRTSCEEDPYMHATDYVRFLVDGVEKGRLDGISGWEAFSARIDTDGPHVLTWEYVKDGSDSAGEDCAWVDEVKFAPDAVAWIRFNGNDSTSGTLPDSISHYLGEKVTLPARGTLARARYDFAGWSDGSKVYGPMAVYDAPDKDVTLLAAWTPRFTAPPTIHAPERYAALSTNVWISESSGAAIYYTTDGSEPTEDSARYWGTPFEISGTTVIKAIAVADNCFPSEVVTMTSECLWKSATVNGVKWYYTADGTLVKGVGASGKFVLPNKLNGTAITKVGGGLFWVRGSGNISGPVAIVVPEGIVEMEYMALEGCDNLEVIVLPSTLKKIGGDCFSECDCLARVYWCMAVPPAIDQRSEGRDDGGEIYWGSNASLISYLPKGWGDLSTHRWNERAFVEWTPPANGATGMIDEIVGKIVPKVMVTFNAHGGYSEETGRAVDSGSAIGVLPVPTRTGYSFDGWYSAATGGTLFGATSKVTADITLHAHWTPIIYAIRYELEGGVNAAGNPSSYTVEQRIVLEAPRKTGYTFKGWTPNGGVIAAGSIGDRRFVAVWELNAGETAYTLMFNANGGECESSERSVLKGGEYGELPVPTRTGYDFGGWFTASEGGSRVSDKTVADRDATLFAHWTPILYPITYVLGGGRNAAENPATYTIEDAVVLLVPVRDGYLFTGWTPDGGRIAKGSIGERTFTATWKAPEPGTPIVVTFDANGGSVTETSRTVKSGAAVGELPTPVRSGYTFAGWWTAASGGERISESTIVISNVTFYAHWTTGVSFLGVATWKFYEEADDDEGLNLAAWEEWSAADVPFWIGEGINMAIPVDGSFTADDVALVAGSYSDYGRPQVVSDEWMFAKHYTSLKTAIGYDPYEDGEYDQGAYGLVFEDDVRGRNYSLSMDIWPQKKVLSGRKWILLEMGGNPTKGCKTFYLGVKGRDDVGYSRFRIYATPDQGVSQRPSDWSSQRELAVLPMPIGGGTTTGSGMYVNGTRVSLSATPVAGYEFEGWYDQSSGQQLGTSTSLTYVMGDANSVIIAKFTLATECFMTFDANGGTPKTQSVKQRSEELFVLPAEPKLADHLFMGWWTEKNGGVKVTDETVFLTGVYETLYAHWTKKRAVSAQICEDAFSGFGTVELDDDDNIVVTLTSDVNGTVEIPDDVGRVLIDLNGHSIIGADGSAAIRVVSGNGDGEITRLSIGDTSDGDKGIIAGDGESVAIDIADDAAPSVHLDVYDDVAVLNGDGTEQQWRELFPVELSIQVGEYFKATLAGLGYNVPTDGKTPYTVKALGLPAGLKLVGNKAVKDKKGKITKKANVEWWIEGVPTAPLDFMTNPPYLVITVNGETRTETLPVDVKAQEVVDLGELELGQSINTNGWLAGVGAGWTVSGLPTGLKYATKKVTKTTGSGKKKVATTVAEAYAVYGKTTKAGLFTITAKQKVGGYYETLKYRVLVKPAPVDTALFGEELANITTMAYVPFEWDLTNDVAAVGGNVSKVAGLPNGVTFAAATTYKDKKKTQVKQYGQTIVGTPTKPGTYVVTFTKNVKSGKTTVAKTAQILWTVVENDAELELAFNIAGGVIEGGSAGLKYGDLMAFTATDGAAVTASGMPAGIALANLGDGNYAFTGFTEKAGTYLVAVTATLNGKTVTQRMALEVDGLPSWAKGTFNGYIAGVDGATNGLATITVSSVGKISGKFQEGGTNWTFTAASYIGYDSAAPAYSVPVVAKYSYKEKEKVKGNGKWTTKTIAKYVARDFTLRVGQDALGGVATLEEVGGGSTVHAWQNLWGQADYKALGKQLFSTKSGKKTLAYRTFTIKGTDDVGAEMGLADAMSLSLKVTTAGAVTVTMSFDTGKTSKGKAVIYKPTCSTVVIPLSAADAEEFEGEAILFFAPSSANGFPGFAGAAPF